VDDKLTTTQLAELRKKLATTSITAVKDAYQSAHYQCRLDGDKIPSARAIQTLVQAWREMRGWSKVTEQAARHSPLRHIPAHERFDDAKAREGIQRATMRTFGATDFG
jgi:hypothetical protein